MAEGQKPEIPNRLFFRIGDVSGLTGIETYVLRFWESEFPMLAPRKTSNGQRQYRRKDVETVLEIKRLLYDEGYTIAGARKALRQSPKRKRRTSGKKRQEPLKFVEPAGPSSALGTVKKELQDILALLGKH